MLDAKLFNASVIENLFEPLPQSTYLRTNLVASCKPNLEHSCKHKKKQT
jgi:hypothetical protein